MKPPRYHILTCIAALTAPLHADPEGQDIRFDDCPAKVKATIRANTAGGIIDDVEWLRIDGRKIYIADIDISGSRDRELFVLGNGNLLKIREDMPFRKLPEAVKKTVKTFAGRVDDVDLEISGGTKTYQIELDRYGKPDLNLLLSETGEVLDKTVGEDPYDIHLSVALLPDIDAGFAAGESFVSGQGRKSFGTTPVGSQGVTRKLFVRNAGSSALENISITTSGSHATDFQVSSPAKTSFAPGEEMALRITFKPGGTGTRHASIHITSNDPDESPFIIRLSGAGA